MIEVKFTKGQLHELLWFCVQGTHKNFSTKKEMKDFLIAKEKIKKALLIKKP